MAPRAFTLPKATTASAKAARAAFFCELCQKGYSRMNEFEAHESSYDHQHKKRLKEMREMQRQVQSSNKKDEKGPLMSIKLGSSKTTSEKNQVTGGAGFKKGGFKNAFAPADVEVDDGKVKREENSNDKALPMGKEDEDSDITDEEDYYDPHRPTGCTPACASQAVVGAD